MAEHLADRTNLGPDHRHPEDVPLAGIDERLPIQGDAAIRAFPDAFDHRQRPVCGRWSSLGGPCVCGDPDRHRELPRVDLDARADP